MESTKQPVGKVQEAVAFKFINGAKGWSVLPLDIKRWEALPHALRDYARDVEAAVLSTLATWEAEKKKNSS